MISLQVMHPAEVEVLSLVTNPLILSGISRFNFVSHTVCHGTMIEPSNSFDLDVLNMKLTSHQYLIVASTEF